MLHADIIPQNAQPALDIGLETRHNISIVVFWDSIPLDGHGVSSHKLENDFFAQVENVAAHEWLMQMPI